MNKTSSIKGLRELSGFSVHSDSHFHTLFSSCRKIAVLFSFARLHFSCPALLLRSLTSLKKLLVSWRKKILSFLTEVMLLQNDSGVSERQEGTCTFMKAYTWTWFSRICLKPTLYILLSVLSHWIVLCLCTLAWALEGIK